jgi:hypothetical protein
LVRVPFRNGDGLRLRDRVPRGEAERQEKHPHDSGGNDE